MSTNKNLIINYAPTGVVPNKESTPYVPISVEEIIEDVQKAYEHGITIVHLHARDVETGESSCNKEIYADIIGGIRKFAPDLVICVSLSGRNCPDFEKRSEPLDLIRELKPDMGSLTLSSLNFTGQASMNSPQMVQALAKKMMSLGVMPELEAFDLGMVNYMKYLIRKDFIKPPYYINLFFNNIAGVQADFLHVGMMIRDLPQNTYWSLAGIGTSQLQLNSMAIFAGSGVRVGLEDNIYFDNKNKRLATNSELIERVHVLAEISGRKILEPSEFRRIFNLKEGYGNYGLMGQSPKQDGKSFETESQSAHESRLALF